MLIPDDLYERIWRMMPIPCVDLLVQDDRGHVLLVKRKQEPAINQWWFPGGRVHHGETRIAAAHRKLLEECRVHSSSLVEVGTFDVMLRMPNNDVDRHGITTVFHSLVPAGTAVLLDEHAWEADWRLPSQWLNEPLHDFVKQMIEISIGSPFMSQQGYR